MGQWKQNLELRNLFKKNQQEPVNSASLDKIIPESSKQNQNLKRKLKFTAPKENVQAAFQKNFKKVQKNVTVTGFRPGKAPKNTLTQTHHYGTIWEKTANDLFNEFFPETIKENQLHVAGEPNILNVSLEENKPCTFEIEVEVHPQVIVKNYLNLQVKQEDSSVTRNQLDEALKGLQEEFKEYKDIDDKTAELSNGFIGSFSIEARLKKNNKQFKPLCTKQAVIKIGSNQLAPGFDAHITGMKIDEQKEFHFSFPKDTHNPQLAGETLFFKMHLLNIKKEVIHSLDDLAKTLKMKDLKDLEERVEKRLQRDNNKKAEERFKDSILNELIKQNPIPLPETLVEKEKKALSKTMTDRLKVYNPTEEDTKKFLNENQKNIEETAKKNVHASYLLETLIKDLEIKVENKELEAYLEEHSSSLSVQERNNQLKNQNFKDNLDLSSIREQAASLPYGSSKACVTLDKR